MFFPYNNSIGLPIPVIGPGWSLNYEIYFYLVFAFLLIFPRRNFVLFMSTFFLVSCLFSLVQFAYPVIDMLTNSLLVEFLLGIYIVVLYEKKRLPDYRVPTVIAFFLIVMNVLVNVDLTYRLFYFGITASFMVLAGVAYESQRPISKPNPGLMFLAEISYSLYLSHVFTYKVILKIFPTVWIANSPDLIICLTVIISIFAVSLVCFSFEKPVTQLLTNSFVNRKTLSYVES